MKSPRHLLIVLAALGVLGFCLWQMRQRAMARAGEEGGFFFTLPQAGEEGGFFWSRSGRRSAKLTPQECLSRLRDLAKRGPDTVKADGPDLMKEILKLDTPHMTELIALLLAEKGMDENYRMLLAQCLFAVIARKDPDAAVAIFDRLSDSVGEPGNRAYLLEGILTELACSKPDKAVEIATSHGDVWPDATARERSMQEIFFSSGAQDPGIALNLITKLGSADPAKAVRLAFAGKPMELDLVREFIAQQPGPVGEELRRGAFGLYGENLASTRPFPEVIRQFDAAGLSAEEMLAVARGVAGQDRAGDMTAAHGMDGTVTPVDIGSWLGWLEQRLPGDEYPAGSARLVNQWARTDADAAEQWLDARADSPAKTAAATAFITAVAPADPDRATRMAMTLPEADRPPLLEAIRQAGAAVPAGPGAQR